MLLVATLLLYYDQDAQDGGINMQCAYTTGIAMLAAFVASFVIFTHQKTKLGFAF